MARWHILNVFGGPSSAAGLVVTALTTAALAGCYAQVPVSLETVGPSSRVLVSLSPTATDEVAEVIGIRQSTVTARIAAQSPAGVSLLLSSAYGDPIAGGRDLYQEVHVDRSDVLGVRRLELNRARTGLGLGALAASVVAVAIAIFSGESGSTPEGPNGNSNEALIPRPVR